MRSSLSLWVTAVVVISSIVMSVSGQCVYTARCVKNCHWHGQCITNTTTNTAHCSCSAGWEGAYCETPICDHCSTHSQCMPNGDCLCNEGYAGENCTELVCPPHTNSCCDKKGHCICDGGPCPEGTGVDLVIVESQINPTIVERTFGECHCAVDEGCTVPGFRRLLRFGTHITNIADLDLFIGYPGATTDDFDYHDCHNHAHFLDTAEFSLWNLNQTVEVVEGMKHGFCLVDTHSTRPGPPVYNCLNQGLQSKWTDVYSSGLDCQWLDISDLPAGSYMLSMEVNPTHAIVEANYTNNKVLMVVDIPTWINAPVTSSAVSTSTSSGSSVDGTSEITSSSVSIGSGGPSSTFFVTEDDISSATIITLEIHGYLLIASCVAVLCSFLQ